MPYAYATKVSIKILFFRISVESDSVPTIRIEVVDQRQIDLSELRSKRPAAKKSANPRKVINSSIQNFEAYEAYRVGWDGSSGSVRIWRADDFGSIPVGCILQLCFLVAFSR